MVSTIIFMSRVPRTFKGLSKRIIIDSTGLFMNKTVLQPLPSNPAMGHRLNQQTGSCEKDRFEGQGLLVPTLES